MLWCTDWLRAAPMIGERWVPVWGRIAAMGGMFVSPISGLKGSNPAIQGAEGFGSGGRVAGGAAVPVARVARRWVWVVVVAAAVGAVAAFLGSEPGSSGAQLVGDFAILTASAFAVVSCFRAARRGGGQARAWGFMTAATVLWAAAQALWTFYGITQDHVYPFPSLADAGFIGYAVPAAAALFLLPRTARAGLLRPILDAGVIAAAVLFISLATVLEGLYRSPGQDVLGHLTGMAYPVVDMVMSSIVLVLMMRCAPGERRPWLFLGAGLVLLTVTDSTYVKLTFDGATGVTGTPLAAGWILAFLLIGAAPLAPPAAAGRADRSAYILALELLPYTPVVGAAVVFMVQAVDGYDPVLLVTGLVVLMLVLARQILIVFENVTLTRELERKVAVRTAELDGLGAIVNSSADAIVGKTPTGVVTSWNPGAETIYGYPADEAIGRHSDFFIPAYLLEAEHAILAAAAEAGQTTNFETERVRRDGSVVAVSVTMSPVRGVDGIHGVATIGRDITERRAAEAELLAAREAALEASRLKSEFLATMSHEIRTPMNGVIGLTGLLLDTVLDETQRRYADGVKGAGEALLTLINDILDFSKLEAGKVDLDPRPFDPRLLVDEVAGLVAGAAQAKGLELIAYCRPEVPSRLTGDAGRIRQVLLNLASNAVKFTASGEVSIRAGVREGGVVPAACFEVRDTGIGINAIDQERVFESFSQADASTTRRYGGTGLGLAISRRLTEAMGGQIGVDSSPGQGSTFWFTLPLAAAEDGSPLAETGPATGLPVGLRVLVVDDNATNRLVLESQLTAWRMRPVMADDAAEALDCARQAAAAGEPFDIALLDMCMPGMNGLDLAQAIRAENSLQGTRLILLSSTAHVDKDRLAAAGVSEWLTKPVRSSELYDRLVRLMAPPAPDPTADREVMATTPAARPAVSLGRVLVVEDNEVNQLVARAMITRLGYTVDVAADGADAITATATVAYAAVLMDCHMPVMDGFEATRAIRARGTAMQTLPIIAMTAGALDEDRERCLAAGMDDYLSKPVDPRVLEETLARWVTPAPVDPDTGPAAIEPARLEVLRGLGPPDGQGLLPAAAEAFRADVPSALEALRQASTDGRVEALRQAAHKLRGAAANIGAGAAALLCAELEQTGGPNGPDGMNRHGLLTRLEAELVRVDKALERALSVNP